MTSLLTCFARRRKNEMQKKEMISMLLAGGQGSRLGILTKDVAKPAVMFGGKYRIIDFTLSNCINSGVDTVGVLIQYQPLRLNQHIGIGIPWDLDRKNGGVTILSPHVKGERGEWYSGTANAVYQNIHFIEQYDPEYVLILSGDHIYKMDYGTMLEYHKKTKSQGTIAVLEVPMEEAHRFGIMNTDAQDRIIEFDEKPQKPKNNLASMGIYIFNWDILKQALYEDQKCHENSDFGKHIIPYLLEQKAVLSAYRFQGYWKDVGTIESYWKANMELIEVVPDFNLHEEFWKIYTSSEHQSPQYVGEEGLVQTSILAEGCEIYGQVYHSIIGPGVVVGKGTIIRDSIIMGNTIIEENTIIERCIIAEECRVGSGVHMGMGECISNHLQPNIYHTGITVIGDGSTIPDGVEIGKNCVIAGETEVSHYPQQKLSSGDSLLMEGGRL